MKLAIDILALVCLAAILLYFIYIVYYTLDLFFLNPFKKTLRLTAAEKQVINNNLPFYKKLEPRLKQKFEKRIVRFRNRKKIIFHEDVQERERLTLLLSATACMITLGLSDFLILAINRIVIYPEAYYSNITKQNHYGEYNPFLKTPFFSAKQLEQGFHIPNDNINLAVHELGHALSFNVANKLNVRSYIFLMGMNRLKRLLKNEEFIAKWDKHNYFRPYGKTNVHEFFAVILESFIETPKEFKKYYPELYKIIRTMLNMGFYKLP